jgi:hypothetical protein
MERPVQGGCEEYAEVPNPGGASDDEGRVTVRQRKGFHLGPVAFGRESASVKEHQFCFVGIDG